MRFRQLDLALEVLGGCERFGDIIRSSLARRAPDLSLRFDHYGVRRQAYACPALVQGGPAGGHEAYVDRFVPVALERVASLAKDLRGTIPTLREELPEAATACLIRVRETAEPDAGLVHDALDVAISLVAQAIASNLIAAPNRVLQVALPSEATALAVTLDEDVQHGWADGNLRMILVGEQGAPQSVKLNPALGLPEPYSCETLPPEALTNRPRLRVGWPAERPPKAIRFQQHGGWPSPQGQVRLLAPDAEGRTILDLNPVKTALDLLAWLGRLSCEERVASGRNNPVACLGWQYLMTNDFASLRMFQKALGSRNALFDDVIGAVAAHNRILPPPLQRVVGRHKFARPLAAEGLGEVVRQMAGLDAILRAELGAVPFLTHATLMGCVEGGEFFPDEDRVSLALVVEAESRDEVLRFGVEAEQKLAPRVGVKRSVNAGALVGLTCTLDDAADPVPIELLVFRRDRAGRVFGVGEGARELAFERDWFSDSFDEAAFYGRPVRIPRRWQGYLADLSGSRWSIQGLWYGALSSVRPSVEACLRRVRTERDGAFENHSGSRLSGASAGPLSRAGEGQGEGPDLSGEGVSLTPALSRTGEGARRDDLGSSGHDAVLRFVGLRDLACDPDADVTPLSDGRPYVRPAADLVADLSGLGYRHDLSSPLRTPLSPVALVAAPPGTIVRGTMLLELPGRRLFMPRLARHDGAALFAESILAAPDPSLPSSHFFSGLGRDADGQPTLAEREIRDIPGDVLWATPDEWGNWGVWIVQTLPAIVRAERAGFDGTLLCWVESAWQRRFLETFAPRLARRLVPQESDCAYRAGGRVHVVAQETRTMALTAFSRAIYAELAKRALREVPAGGAGERLFVSRLTHSRANPDYRALENEPELIDALAPHGFRAVEPERLDVMSQIALFARAREIVGLGGAGMFNLAFAREGASVLDIESSPGWVASHTNLFATSGLRFGVIFGRPIAGTGPHARWTLPLPQAMPLVRDFFGLG